MSKKSNWSKTPVTKPTSTNKQMVRRRKSQLVKTEEAPIDNRPVEVVIFVPHTNNSSLKNMLQLNDDKVTKPLALTQGVQNSNPAKLFKIFEKRKRT